MSDYWLGPHSQADLQTKLKLKNPAKYFSESCIHQSKRGEDWRWSEKGVEKKDGGYDWEPWKCFDTSSLYTVTEKWDFVASYVSREKIIHFLHGDYLLRVAATTTQQQ